MLWKSQHNYLTRLTVHVKKSVLVPVQRIEYLGFELDSVKMIVTLTPRKKEKVRKLAKALLNKWQVMIQELAVFIGNLMAAEQGVTAAPLQYRGLEIIRNEALAQNCGNYDVKFVLSQKARADVKWWLDNIWQTSKQVRQKQPEVMMESDASNKGVFFQRTTNWG